jgi:rhodanese-related sulfurtransferase
VFIDVRNDSDWEAGWIPGAVHLDSEKVFSKSMLAQVVQPDQEVVIYCNGANCPRNSQAVAQAVAWGFARVYYYRLGFPDWQAAGHPLE